MYFTYLLIRERLGAIGNGNVFVLVCRVEVIGFIINSSWHQTFLLILCLMGVNTSNKESISIILKIFDLILLICALPRTVNIICSWLISWPCCSTHILIGIWRRRLFLFIVQNIEIVNVNIEFLISILSRGVIHIYFS